MKPFLLFGMNSYEQNGGANDLIAIFDTYADAVAGIAKLEGIEVPEAERASAWERQSFEYYQILDTAESLVHYFMWTDADTAQLHIRTSDIPISAMYSVGELAMEIERRKDGVIYRCWFVYSVPHRPSKSQSYALAQPAPKPMAHMCVRVDHLRIRFEHQYLFDFGGSSCAA